MNAEHDEPTGTRPSSDPTTDAPATPADDDKLPDPHEPETSDLKPEKETRGD